MKKEKEIINPQIFGLAYGCPKGSREQTCPFTQLESLNFSERVNWIMEVGVKKVNSIIDEHDMCSCRNC